MQHGQGFDLRFELESGTKLDHEIERHDLVAGTLLAWVRLPSLDLAGQLRLFVYYGKSGLAAAEANPAGVWQGYLAVDHTRSGVDRTGQGRTLTPSAIGAGELIGGAGAFNGSAIASRADATFLGGRTALTVQAMVSADASMVGNSHGILAQGPMDGTDSSAGSALSIWHKPATARPTWSISRSSAQTAPPMC